MAKLPKDIAASFRQRLLNLARQEGQVFDVVLVAFGLERLVYRLSVSDYRDRFVLKGGMFVSGGAIVGHGSGGIGLLRAA